MAQRFDPYPTVKMAVPNLKELLARLRDGKLRNAITIVHAENPEQAEWIFATAAARLTRSGVRVFGPESLPPAGIVEQALRIGAKTVLAGEMRRADDAQALRAAAALGINIAATISKPERHQAQELLDLLGPWTNYDLLLLSRQLPTR
jgi:hypothetical protein